MKKNRFTGSENPGKKGYIMILDAIIAMALILTAFTVVVSIHNSATSKTSSMSFKSIHYISEDVLDVLNKQGALDYIGTDWAAANGSAPAWSNESNVSLQYMDKLIPGIYGYRLEIDGAPVYDSTSNASSGRPVNSSIKTSETHSSRLLVGFGKGMPTRGQVARAYLSNIGEKVSSIYAYFGGFEGQGNLTKQIELPAGMDTIKSICLEYDAGDDFDLAIDGSHVTVSGPAYFQKSPGDMNATSRCIENPTGYISPGYGGMHNFAISFRGSDLSTQYIGGGYIKIEYNTSEFDESPDTGISRYNFPGIAGLINLYSSFYVPGTPLNTMSIHLKFDNNYTTYLTFGNTEIFNTTSASNRKFCNIYNNRSYTCDILNQNVSRVFAYGSNSQKTIPLRMGVRDLFGTAGMLGTADVVLITDVSGSMNYCLQSESTCSSPNRRIDLAKTLDKEFINIILQGAGNRVGLVSFSTDTSSLSLTSNEALVDSTVDGYSANGGTCLCCAINRAMQLFNDSLTLIPQGSDWKYKLNSSSCGDQCNPSANSICNITGWHNFGYNDSSWSTLSPVTSGDNTGLSGVVAYYRKHFNVTYTSIAGNATFSIRNRRGVECYLNGHLIGRDTNCATASYWTHSAWQVPSTWFNSTGNENVLACKLRCGTSSSSRRGIQFDAKLTASQKRYIIVMSDGVTGYSCGQCNNNPACSNPVGLCSGGPCTQTSADDSLWSEDYQCSGTPPGDCTNTDCQPAMNDAICAARRAYNNYGAQLFSVGFGPVASCSNGAQTLQNIAQCGTGNYTGSDDPDVLEKWYQQMAEIILNATKESQIINITEGEMEPSKLYPESYIEFGYTPVSNSTYGEISITDNKTLFQSATNCNGNLNISSIVTAVSDAKVTSYSAEHWTNYLNVNNIQVYNLSSISSVYDSLGDPYIVQIPSQYLHSGPPPNSIILTTGDSLSINTNCSTWDQIIYTMRLSGRVSYGDVFPDRNGCNWNIEFFGNSTPVNDKIPLTYAGNKTCYYTSSNHDRGENVSSDAVNDAIYRLLIGLDANNDGVVDIKFNTNQVEFSFSQAGGVRSLWGPINMKLIVWM
jgi:hypothetical protein